jgi:hypothetical protein
MPTSSIASASRRARCNNLRYQVSHLTRHATWRREAKASNVPKSQTASSDGRCLTAGIEPCGAPKCRTDCIRGPAEYQSLREPDAMMCLRKCASINKVLLVSDPMLKDTRSTVQTSLTSLHRPLVRLSLAVTSPIPLSVSNVICLVHDKLNTTPRLPKHTVHSLGMCLNRAKRAGPRST